MELTNLTVTHIAFSQPTTGLDSRAAMIVMKSLKLVAQTGRTVIATVHQPSSAAFSMFVSLNDSDFATKTKLCSQRDKFHRTTCFS